MSKYLTWNVWKKTLRLQSICKYMFLTKICEFNIFVFLFNTVVRSDLQIFASVQIGQKTLKEKTSWDF